MKKTYEKPTLRKLSPAEVVEKVKGELTPLERDAFLAMAIEAMVSPNEKPN